MTGTRYYNTIATKLTTTALQRHRALMLNETFSTPASKASDSTEFTPHVAIVILNFKGWRDTLACVKSLFGNALPGLVSVIVADNASSDGSMRHLVAGLSEPSQNVPVLQLTQQQAERGEQANAPMGRAQLVFIQNEQNWGFAGGCNPAIRWALAAGADFVWLLNNDTEVAAGALQSLLARFQARPDMGLCGSKLVYHDNRQAIQSRGGATFNPMEAIGEHLGIGEHINAPEDVALIEKQMDYVVGASMMASRAFIDKVGLLTDDYLLYYEELDWATRGKQRGFALGYAADSVVFHKEGATIGSSHRHYSSALSHRFLSRNRLLFTQRFYPQHLRSVRWRMFLELLVWLARRMPGHALIIAQALLGRPVKLPS